MQLQFNPLTIILLLPSLITLVVLRIRRRPWEKTLSLLGWRLGSPVYYLRAFLILLLTAIPIVLIGLFVFPDLYRHPPRGTSQYYYARLGLSLFSILSAFLNEFFFTALGEEAFFRGLLGGWFMRRFGFLVGNTLQTLIFLIPHLAVLLFATYLWPLLAFPVLLGWLNGWLRYKSNSILPGMFIHALGNTLSDVLAMWIG
jgi:membrane protease YdiL (CAAX protease family)